ncbi:unnamed protein product [Knipowitschia caucasica]|uniref:TNFR-Cys domain-containing protein n=1 Tax=Knipowitschia caucasica TaxID=637954 RepID=A0AAV2M4T9_KNICA
MHAMEDLVLLLLLLQIHPVKLFSLPFAQDDNRNCSGPRVYVREMREGRPALCCSRCPPGQKLKQECTEAQDSVCEPCGAQQFAERWNYASNCGSCVKCKESKGLRYAQNCSSTTKAKCVCQPHRYCFMGYKDGYCQECGLFTKCRQGFGVSVQGTASSDVQCQRCEDGTFSASVSSTETCKPHSPCDETHVISKGNATADTVCRAADARLTTEPQILNHKTGKSVLAAKSYKTTRVRSFPIMHDSSSSTPAHVWIFPSSVQTKSQLDSEPEKQLAAVVGGVAGVFLLLILLVLLVLCKRKSKKGNAEIFPKVDANGNCETDTDTNHSYLGDTGHFSFNAVQPEQQGLLQNMDTNLKQSMSNSTEHLHSTLPQPHSAFSEPFSLQSNTDFSVASSSLQSFSQPTSPQSTAPSPLVNVNINLHIGNGTCGTPAVTLRDIGPAESAIPFGEEEESCCSYLQQEDGKPSLLSVEESGSFNR